MNNPEIADVLKNNLLKIIEERPENFEEALKHALYQNAPIKVVKAKHFGNDFLDESLRDCPIFNDDKNLEQFDFEIIDFVANDVIIKEGDNADYLYIILEGKCDVYKNDEKVNVVEEGEYFGELAFQFKTTREATVVASGNVKCYRLPASKL